MVIIDDKILDNLLNKSKDVESLQRDIDNLGRYIEKCTLRITGGTVPTWDSFRNPSHPDSQPEILKESKEIKNTLPKDKKYFVELPQKVLDLGGKPCQPPKGWYWWIEHSNKFLSPSELSPEIKELCREVGLICPNTLHPSINWNNDRQVIIVPHSIHMKWKMLEEWISNAFVIMVICSPDNQTAMYFVCLPHLKQWYYIAAWEYQNGEVKEINPNSAISELQEKVGNVSRELEAIK